MRTDRISRLAALSMLMALTEAMLPHPVPFLKYGLSNIPLLLALPLLTGKEFLLLSLIKGITVSLLSGTLFSVIGLMSTLQSITAGCVMLLLHRLLKDRITVWSISAAGAFFSTLSQILFSVLWLGKGVLALAPWMLLLSTVFGLVTAGLSLSLPVPRFGDERKEDDQKERKGLSALIVLIAVTAVSSVSKNIYMLIILFVSGLIMMAFGRKRFMLLPWINIFIISVLSGILSPMGEVIFRVFSFPVTLDALMTGVINALRISSTVAWSLALSGKIRFSGIIGETFSSFTEKQDALLAHEGKLSERLRTAVML